MRANDYLDPDLQKAFLPTVPGVVEHQAKLAAVIKSAYQQKRSLGIAWLDIANAYMAVSTLNSFSLLWPTITPLQSSASFCSHGTLVFLESSRLISG